MPYEPPRHASPAHAAFEPGITAPLALARQWLELARRSEPSDPDAAALATISPEGRPENRLVLVRELDDRAAIFYSHAGSAKGAALAANPAAELVFHWKSLRRQMRIAGPVETVPAAHAARYFARRSRRSQLAARISAQSRPLSSRDEMETRLEAEAAALGNAPVPPPADWRGYAVIADRVELWQDGPDRLHDRFLWTRTAEGWSTPQRLFP